MKPPPLYARQLEELAHHHPGAMTLLLDGRGDYVYVSDECSTVLGYKPAEVIGHNALEFAAPEDTSHAAVTIQDAKLNDESVAVGIRVRAKNGELRVVRGGAMRADDASAETDYLIGWVSLVP